MQALTLRVCVVRVIRVIHIHFFYFYTYGRNLSTSLLGPRIAGWASGTPLMLPSGRALEYPQAHA